MFSTFLCFSGLGISNSKIIVLHVYHYFKLKDKKIHQYCFIPLWVTNVVVSTEKRTTLVAKINKEWISSDFMYILQVNKTITHMSKSQQLKEK